MRIYVNMLIKVFCLTVFACGTVGNQISWAQDAPAVFKPGESFAYDIKKMKMKAGEASLVIDGPVQVEGQEAYLITFTSQALNFLDEEKIFVDSRTFFPIKVERRLNIFGKKENITEYYDQKQGVVTIVKKVGGKDQTQTIKKQPPVENIYGFIYRFRLQGKFEQSKAVAVNLPTKDVKIKMVERAEIDYGGNKVPAFIMESDPKQYTIWIQDNPERTPLRIDGAVGIGKTSLILQPNKNK